MVKVISSSCCIKYVIILILHCHEFKALSSLDCNFDDDLCGWASEVNSDFEWLRESNYTSSTETGPASDHTTGDDGYYIYIEASGKTEGDKARLRSPVQNPGHSCLIFWYSMYGSDIGALQVYMVLSNGIETLLFTRDKKVDNRNWRNVIINNNASDRYQIVIEGVRGDGNKGDIAVDDISMTHEWCSVDCDFERGLCNWIQDDLDDFDWKQGAGHTSTRHTGPDRDHTTGYGRYVYIDSSSENRMEKALLLSPILTAGTYCFSFWYHMYGVGIDRLRVLQLFEQGKQVEIFTKVGNIGQKWVLASLGLHSTAYFKIIFEARVKNVDWHVRDLGDIAVDDIRLFSCQDCDNPTPEHAIINSTNFEYGSVIKVTCEKGYELIGESLLVCETDGSWSASRPTCKLYDCGDRNIPNGLFIAPEGTTFGQAGTYVCNVGYYLVGNSTISCTATGWNSTDTTCEINDCGSRTLSNGKFSAPEGTTFGQTATQVCNTGYTLIGDTTVNCTASGWSGTTSTCDITDTEEDQHEKLAVIIIVPVVLVSAGILAIVFAVVILKKRKQQNYDDIYHVYSTPDEQGMAGPSNDTETYRRPSSAGKQRCQPTTSNVKREGKKDHGMAKDSKVSYVNEDTLNEMAMSFERFNDNSYEMLQHSQASGSDYTTIDQHNTSSGNSSNVDGNYEMLNRSETHEDNYRTLQF